MKRLFLSMLFTTLVTCLTSATAQDVQEILKGGNMEDESAWTVYNLNSDVEALYLFNYTDEKPQAGEGGCLFVIGETTNEINILFWQEVTLIGGVTYEISGAFKDLTGGNLNQFWCDIDLSTEAPVEGVNYRPTNDANTDIRVSMNTWNGCGSGTDGTFQDDGCSGTGSSFTVPDSYGVGEEVTYYFGIKPGVWAGGPLNEFEILIDEMSLKSSAPTAKAEEKYANAADRFILHQNYPNPFNPTTIIRFNIKEKCTVKLNIYNIQGRLVNNIREREYFPGSYEITFSGEELPSGIYFYRLQGRNFTDIKKMILLE